MEKQPLKTALGAGPECLSIERLARYADGLLSDEERRADEAHVAACANCEAELALLHAFATVTVRDDETTVVREGVAELRRRESEIFDPIRRDDPAWKRWLSFAALRPALTLAVVLLAVVGSYYLTNPAAPRLPADIGFGSEATRSLGIPVLEPVGDQTTVPRQLRWQAVGGASRYHVSLREVDRHEIWSSDSAETAIDLPEAVQTRIVPAKTLVWQVTAYGAANMRIAESDPQRFRLSR